MSLCIKDLNKFILFDEDLNRYLIKLILKLEIRKFKFLLNILNLIFI